MTLKGQQKDSRFALAVLYKCDEKDRLMCADVVLPNLGFGMEEGRLLAWLKKSGDTVKKGEPIAEIESDKAAVELEAVVDGTLDEILVAADTVVAVGTVLARIRTSGAASASMPANTAPIVVSSPQANPVTSDSQTDSVRATPLAKRVAADQGVTLSEVRGTGAGGRITRSDVQNAASGGNGHSNGHSVRVLAAPAVRKLARDQNVDLSAVRGTAESGRVTRADLEAVIGAAQSKQPTPSAAQGPSSAERATQPSMTGPATGRR